MRDGWLIERLEQELPTLDSILSGAGLSPGTSRGQGFQVEGDENTPPAHFYNLKVLTPKEYTPFRVKRTRLEPLSHDTLHRPREAAIYKGPLVVCPKASFKKAAQLGRYGVAVTEADLLYTESFYGVSFHRRDSRLAYALSGILNSSVTTFQLAFGGGAWGLERATVEPKDLLSLRVPNIFADVAKAMAIVEAEILAAADPADPSKLALLDQAVAAFYGLEPEEAVLVNESIERARMLIFESRLERQRFVKPPAGNVLHDYSATVVRVIDNYLRANGKRHLEATVYQRSAKLPEWRHGSPGLTAVRFKMAVGEPSLNPIVHPSSGQELQDLGSFLQTKLQTDIAPYLNERRLLRIYAGDDLFVVKPSEVRYWTQASGLNDADIILADHWVGARHAAHA